jgi:hypothetical protein
VFLSFTLSQSGMARRWWKIGKLKEGKEIVGRDRHLRYTKGWRIKMFINGLARCARPSSCVIFAVTKFHEGAWLVLIIIPALVKLFFTIHHHYKDLASHLTLDKFSGLPARQTRHRVIMPISGIHQGTLEGLRYAKLLSDDVTAIHVSIEPDETRKDPKEMEDLG